VQPTLDLPADPALPGLAAIRTVGLGRAIPALRLNDGPVELRLCTRVPGSRATFEARVGDRRFAVKLYADDAAPEAELYQALAQAGLAGASGARVPPLLAWDRDLKVVVLGWLDGRPANELIKQGLGGRAGELAGSWLRRAAAVPVSVGPPCGPGRMLYQVGVSVAALGAVDPDLGTAAKSVARALGRAQPREGPRRLVHGTLYARHIFDLGDGPGVIDWQQFGQGPIEVDAGMFLATTGRLGLRHPLLAPQVARAEAAFLAATDGLLNLATLDWYRAAGLLHLAARGLKTGLKRDPPPEARALVEEAGAVVERAARTRPVAEAHPRPGQAVRRSALELVLRALSSRPATPEELDQIRQLLDDASSPAE
jgi:aminoglycoside phosphotransferase (APT) family kinase protein